MSSVFPCRAVVGQFAVAAVSDRRKLLININRRSLTAATAKKIYHYRQGASVGNEEFRLAMRKRFKLWKKSPGNPSSQIRRLGRKMKTLLSILRLSFWSGHGQSLSVRGISRCRTNQRSRRWCGDTGTDAALRELMDLGGKKHPRTGGRLNPIDRRSLQTVEEQSFDEQ